MIQLDTVVLSDHLIWEDEFHSDAGVAQVVKRTLGGNLVTLSKELSRGVPITLSATVNQGWLTKAQVQGLTALSRQAGAVFTLAIGIQTFSVMFRHDEPPALEADALNQVGAQAPAGYYTATIKLRTV